MGQKEPAPPTSQITMHRTMKPPDRSACRTNERRARTALDERSPRCSMLTLLSVTKRRTAHKFRETRTWSQLVRLRASAADRLTHDAGEPPAVGRESRSMDHSGGSD